MARRYDEAIVELEKILEMDSGSAGAHQYVCAGLTSRSRCGRKRRGAGSRAVELSGRDLTPPRGARREPGLIGPQDRDAGGPRRARRGVSTALVSAMEIAYVHAALGQMDVAFEWVDKAVAERTPFLVLLRVDPRADPLRADPRFAVLLKRIGL